MAGAPAPAPAAAAAKEPPRAAPAPRKKPTPVLEPLDTPDTHGTSHEAGDGAEQLMPGVIRDERGVWIAPEAED
jgi:hypothetical protein